MTYDTSERYQQPDWGGEEVDGEEDGVEDEGALGQQGGKGGAGQEGSSAGAAAGGSADAPAGAAAAAARSGGECGTSGRGSGGGGDNSSWGHRRGTLCVSSQVGCQMGCTFCATGARRAEPPRGAGAPPALRHARAPLLAPSHLHAARPAARLSPLSLPSPAPPACPTT